jgi:HEAT repeat
MKYQEIFPMDRSELEKLIESGNTTAIVDGLLSAAYHDPDWRWVQDLCLRFLDHTDPNVRRNAALCLGYVARIHRDLDLELVLPKLMALKRDPVIAGSLEDALNDIRRYIKVQ